MPHHPKFGAYPELYAGLSQDIDLEQNGSYVIPWGRLFVPRRYLLLSMKSLEEGGSEIAAVICGLSFGTAARLRPQIMDSLSGSGILSRQLD
jgi:hypothetical protein